MIDFKRHFLPEHQLFLENINYERLPIHRPSDMDFHMNCHDTLVACLEKDGVQITLNRKLSFEPENLFYLSVTVGARFRFHPQYSSEVDWNKEDIAGEFRRSKHPALANMMARCSLLIAQITSCTGQIPLVTPSIPNVPESENESNTHFV